MDCFNSIIESIITNLSKDENLSDISFLKSYPISERPSPIDKVYVTVGFVGIDIIKKVFSDYIGEISNSIVYGRHADISLKIKVYSPRRLGGEGCIEAFERVCNSLIFGQNDYLIKSIEGSKVDYDLNLTALTLSSTVKLHSFIKSEKSILPSE